MASGSPRARIDQFFASRKGKPQPLKDGNPEKDPPAAPDESPSAKGSLDGYLVVSPDSDRRHSLVKRNLALEKTVDVSRAPEKDTLEIAEQNSGRNPEIKKFANEFLALYCSELPSVVLCPLKQEHKGQKRSCSPSFLDSNSKIAAKKQCLVDNSNKPAEIKSNSSEQERHECVEFESSEKRDKEIIVSSSKTFSAMRRCSNPCLPKAGLQTPGLGRTPKSIKKSMFSPGDEFWNEAIQVADGLYAPMDDEFGMHKEEENMGCLSGRKSSNKVPMDVSSCVAPRGGMSFSTFSNDESGARDMVCDRTLEKSDKLPTSVKGSKVSPLPVKHFDFAHEENNITRKASILGKSDSVAALDSVCTPTNISPTGHNGVSASIMRHRESCTSELPLKGTSVLHVSEDINSGNPSSAEKLLTSMENAVHLAGGEATLLSKRNGNMLEEKAAKVDDTSSNAGERESGLTAAKKDDGANTPLSFMPSNARLQLTSWLPPEICGIYMKKGISNLYPWQVDCLLVDGVLERRNLVYCASTSAGKSFVAEILMLRRVIRTGKMGILVLPYVSICNEKAEHLEVLLEPLGKHVRSFYGNQGGGSLPKDTSVAVCTIEKANSLVNKLLEDGRLSEVGTIVIDELHMVGDQHRGYLLELMLTKLRYAAGEGNSESSSGYSSGSSGSRGDPANGLQIIGMSATMPNVAAVADWLQAALYHTDFRPVPLEEYIKVGNTIFNKKMDVVRKIPKTADCGGKDPEHIVELCNEVIQEGHSVLLFCSSRKGCETTARHVSRFLKKFSVTTSEACEFSNASSVIEALRKCPAGLDPVLEETLPFGVAYHHAGLTVEEREIVETCYRKGLVRVLTATSTLAAGVNLPARRVIFRQPRVGRDFLDGTRYRQMAGRAGRTGIDTKGESILVCKPEEMKKVSSILNDNCPPLQSCLSEDKNGMTHAIMEVVAGGIVQTASDIHRYVRCTLLNSTKPFQDVVKSAQDSLRWLCHNKFLEWNEETRLYSTTPLGRAAFGSSLSPEESLVVMDDLSRAREGFVLASDLHLVFLVTPINVEIEPDWELYYERFMQLSALDQSVGNRVGVTEPFLMRMAHGAPIPGKKSGPYSRMHPHNMSKDNILLSSEQTLRVAKRFYVSLMLSRLVQEVPVTDVCEAFKVARGTIQALQENAGRFASMVSLFCERLGWHDLEGLVAKFQNRVSFGVRAEIAELTNLPYVKGSRARALYKAGLRTPVAIAEASVPDIAKALFEFSSWAGEGGSALQRMQLGIAKKIKNGARKVVLDQAEEARVAAFSAFKSLGVHVPQISQPLVFNNAEDSVSRGSTGSSREDAISHTDIKEAIKNSSLSAQQVGDDIISVSCDNAYQAISKANANKNTLNVASRGANTANVLESDPNAPTVQLLTADIRPNTGHSGKFDTSNKEASDASPFPVLEGYTTRVVDTKTELRNLDRHVQGRNELNCSKNNVSDSGPVGVSNIQGGFNFFLDEWECAKEFYFDVHFKKLSDLNSCVTFEIFGLAICWENSPVYYINLLKDLVNSGDQFKCHDLTGSSSGDATRGRATSDTWDVTKCRWNRIAKIMAQNGTRKITWNLKVQIQVLKFPTMSMQRFGRLGPKLKEEHGFQVVDGSYLLLPSISVHDGIDICIMAWILWPDEESKSSPNLEKVVKKRLSSEAAAAANRDGRWRNQMHKAAHNGCCRRVAQTRALGSVLWKLLVSENLVEALITIESPLVKVLADMESCGVGVDMEACLNARHILLRKLKELETEAYRLAGVSFSLNTAADIANVLYRHLKLPIPGDGNKGKLHPSTDKHSLDILRDQHPIISVIKEHRTLAKLLNSTLGSICSRAQLSPKSHRYTVQGHLLQTSTATGRLSMEDPNLQCVERTVVFRSHLSDKNGECSSENNHHQINAREFFIPTQDNWLLLTADYSQIELRLMAHFSKDSSLIELLRQPDGDVFTMIAARWTCKQEATVSSKEREQTKRLVYGILYGMGANALAEQLECSTEEATEKIRSFKSSFPGVSSWLQEAISSCCHKGHVETLKGRKRFLVKIKFGNSKERAKAQRQAVNSICQGSAADIIKIAMINIYSVITEGSEAVNVSCGIPANFPMLKGHCRIILQVHDELVLEVDPNYIKEARTLLQTCMENAVSLLVPLRVKLKYGRTWGSLKPFEHQQ